MALSLRRALGLRRGGRGVDEVAGAAIGRPGRDEVVRGPVRRDPPRRASRPARIPRPVHSSALKVSFSPVYSACHDVQAVHTC
jgi:hypothetical protein